MLAPIRSALLAVLDGHDLSEAQAAAAVGAVMDGHGDDASVAGLLVALRMKGEATAELVGAARAMRQRATKIPAATAGLLDTCGTGGDGLATFNISTATALVAAACGVPVAKHGNRAASSASGSADVLEALGVNLSLTPAQVAACVDEVGIGFCFAPLVHGAMKHAAPIRQKLGVRTIFNLLGPLTNPAGAEFQLVGAGRIATAEKLAAALAKLGVDRAVVVCGNDELDEVSLWGNTTLFLVEGETFTRQTWDAAAAVQQFGVTAADLRVESPTESARVIAGVLAGDESPARHVVAVNAAAALFAARQTVSPQEGLSIVYDAIDSGAAGRALHRLVECSNRLASASPADAS